MDEKTIITALEELRKEPARKFTQSVDMIVNLRNFDIKKQSVNLVITLPHDIKERKVCAFLTKKSKYIDTITKEEFEDYKNKKKLKELLKEYDFFIAVAPLMPAVAASFGKVLGPAGKMPSPQLGILASEDEKAIQDILSKINKIVKIKSKEASLKVTIGKEKLKNEELAENAMTIYNTLFKTLPRQKENIKSVMIKFSMTKPIKMKLD